MDKNKENRAEACCCSDSQPAEKKPRSNAKCTCPNTDCPRHGNCEACVLYHREEKGNLPVCLRHLAVK